MIAWIHANIIVGTFKQMVGLLPLEIHLLQLDIGRGFKFVVINTHQGQNERVLKKKKKKNLKRMICSTRLL